MYVWLSSVMDCWSCKGSLICCVIQQKGVIIRVPFPLPATPFYTLKPSGPCFNCTSSNKPFVLVSLLLCSHRCGVQCVRHVCDAYTCIQPQQSPWLRLRHHREEEACQYGGTGERDDPQRQVITLELLSRVTFQETSRVSKVSLAHNICYLLQIIALELI